MGRIRRQNTHLPERLFEQHGGYYYANRQNGKLDWLHLGRDEAKATAQADELNRLKRAERMKVIGAFRAASVVVRDAVMDRDAFQCVYCGTDKDLGIDHVIPYVMGGSSKPFNLVIACASCNATKGAGDPREHILTMLGLREQLMDLTLDLFRNSQDIQR